MTFFVSRSSLWRAKWLERVKPNKSRSSQNYSTGATSLDRAPLHFFYLDVSFKDTIRSCSDFASHALTLN